MKRLLPLLLVLAVVGVFAGTLIFLWQKSQAPPVSHETVQPSKADIVKKTVAPGAIVPREEIAIKPRVSGIVDELFVEAGEIVKEGQLIARIQVVPDMLTLSRAESAVDKARIALQNAEREQQRHDELYRKGTLSDSDFQRYKLDYDLRLRDLEATENDLSVIRKGASRKAGQASNLIHSTVAGTVLDVPVKRGQSVIESNTFNEGTTIALVADMTDLIFQGKIDESEVGKLHEGMAIEIRIGALQEKLVSGRLEYIAPKGVMREGTIEFEIRASIEKPQDMVIRAGYSANADIVLDRREKVLSLPEKVLQFEAGKPFVEIQRGKDDFEKCFLKVGLSDGIRIEVLEGVEANAHVKDPIPQNGTPGGSSGPAGSSGRRRKRGT